MASSAAASFINLDLELKSDEDLAPLARHCGRRVFVLHCGAVEQGMGPSAFRLAVEPVIGNQLSGDPIHCTDHFLELLEAMPLALRVVWNHCASRVFDYGFEGGSDEGRLEVLLDNARLRRIAALGIAVRITLYPYRPPSAAEDE